MVKISTREEVDAYYASSALSQSEYKKLLYGVKNYKDSKDKKYDSDALKLGSVLDTILTAEEGEFEKLYYVSNLSKLPTDAVQKVTKVVRDSLIIKYSSVDGEITDKTIESLLNVSFDTDELDEIILNAVTREKYYTNRKDETRINDIKNYGKDYYFDLINSIGKIVLSSDEKILIDRMVKALRTSKVTGKYFDRKKQATYNKVIFHYQLPIYFMYQGLQCKALLDLCIFVYDDKDKLIRIEPIDLKSTFEETHKFQSVAIRYRYDIQSAWYTTAIETAYALVMNEDTKIANFKFIVESTTTPGDPVIYSCSDEFLRIGREGRNPVYLTDTNLSFDGKSPNSITIKKGILGYEQLIDLYVYYQMNGFNKEKELVENKNVLTLDFD